MNLNAYRRYFSMPLALGLLMAALGSFLFYDRTPLLFESEESKTVALEPVFNRISFRQKGEKDIWIMQQSHQGPHPPKDKWDRVAILVDRSSKPYTATFYQLNPGELSWSEGSETIDYKAACFLCHSNGPRGIRPNFKSSELNLSLKDRMKLILWNLRIKSYGRMKMVSIPSVTPFRYEGARANEVLNSSTCNTCHRESGVLARGSLTRQNFMSIRFLVENGHMPPLGIPLSKEEKKEILRFIDYN